MILYFGRVADVPGYGKWSWDINTERSVHDVDLDLDGLKRLVEKIAATEGDSPRNAEGEP